jgi:hypothetical protein
MTIDENVINQTIDNTSGYIVYLLKDLSPLSQSELIKRFYKSDAFKDLNDREMKYYCDTHRLIYEKFKAELEPYDRAG